MTTFERRQRLVDLLRAEPGIKVTELARRLDVSEGTIRNDLRALQQAGQLSRVRGGAVVRNDLPFVRPAFAARLQVNAQAKQQIACRAAELVEDGDSIVLDASTTVFAMIPYLQERHNLNVVTNGLEAALALSRNRSHAVILTGGMVRSDGTSVVGPLGEKILEGLHVKTAFVSCSGFSLEAGLTEVDIHEVQLKKSMIGCAERVVALVDSAKFGRVDLTSFAGLGQIGHLFTDTGVEAPYIQPLRQAGVVLTVCGDGLASTYSPADERTHYRIGFANLGESMPFAVDVRRGLERAAHEAGNIDLILADNQLDTAVALSVADCLIASNVDLAIEYQIDEKINSLIMDKFRQAGIPVIAVDIPMDGATYFGVNNYRAGHMAGVALGRRVQAEWGGQIDQAIVLEETRPGAVPAARVQGQLDGLQEIVGPIAAERLHRLDCGNTTAISEAQVQSVLAGLPAGRRLVVISFNDDAAMGAVLAFRRAGRERDVLIVGQGADRRVREELRRPETRIVGSTAYWPERYGQKLVEVAQQLLRGEPVPPAVYNEHVLIGHDNIDRYYPFAPEGPALELAGPAEPPRP